VNIVTDRDVTGEVDTSADLGEWTPEDMGERPLSEKKIRRVRRSVTDRSTT